MQSKVVKIAPRFRSLEAAVAAYRDGRPAECLSILRNHHGFEAALLRARAGLRAGAPAHALDGLSIDDAQLASNRARAELLTLRGALETRLGRLDAARDTLDGARVLALGSGSAALEAEYVYYDAVWSFAAKCLDEADCASAAVLEIAPNSFDVSRYFVPLSVSRARALVSRGFVCAARTHYRKQATYNRAAIAELRPVQQDDLWMWAASLMYLSYNVRDLDLQNDAATLRAEMTHAGAWPPELAPMRFEIHRSLGWSDALRGDHLGAFREFRKMSEHATVPARMVLASIERSYLARELGERHSAQEELEHAARLADTVNWNDAGEERVTLILLAQETAAHDPAKAMKLLERYRDLKVKFSPHLLQNFDRRISAYEAMAEGTVLRANGALRAAVARFVTAFEIWHEAGYRWRAATAALHLAELLDDGGQFMDYVRAEAAVRPNSWLERRAKALERVEPLRRTESDLPSHDRPVTLRLISS